ncbi:MAG: hypothetical protein AUJ49_06845 [Desulfovibrionaceae bacterium CG1_02_65_16]|nr:MAG: hypothetical protein AUJ49_06845 [Desulfovibrionaceae bacterium CG1_02_65_16]
MGSAAERLAAEHDEQPDSVQRRRGVKTRRLLFAGFLFGEGREQKTGHLAPGLSQIQAQPPEGEQQGA